MPTDRRRALARAGTGSSPAPTWLLRAALIACVGCAGPSTVDGPPTRVSDACRELVAAAPADWTATLPPVLAAGTAAAAPLVAELSARPDAQGAQAALFALGHLGDSGAAPYLWSVIARDRDSDGTLSAEAALSLGRLGAAEVGEGLLEVARDPRRPVLLRTAAACALLDLGRVDEATPLLVAILLAGTPYGIDDRERYALPDRPRWALERNLVIDAVERRCGDRLGLDADAPWPSLRAGAERMRAALAR